jgi:hypothetical protein
MPGFDGTGPGGMGPMTGGGRGFCSPGGVGAASAGYRKELDSLKNQAQTLRGQLGQIEARIQQLGSES